jgi:thioredoxin 1
LRGARDRDERADSATERLVPILDREADPDAGRSAEDGGCKQSRTRGGEEAAEEDARGRAEPDADADPVPLAHAASVVPGGSVRPSTFGEEFSGETSVSLRSARPDPLKEESVVPDDSKPLLVFFCSERSGPARRMESLLAHLARKERERLVVKRVDVEQRPELAQRFEVEEVPTLVLVKDKRVVARLTGRASAPKIERMIEPHLVGSLV